MPESDIMDYELLPVEGDEFEPEQELDLVDALEQEVVVPAGDPPPRAFGRGWAFNFMTGRMARHGRAPAETRGQETLRTWIGLALWTASGAHAVHPNGFGMEDPFLMMGVPFDAEVQAETIRQIRAALLVHERITAVERFVVTEDDGAVYLSFIVMTDEEPLEIEAFPLGLGT